jgi:hypothetical protein
MANRKITIITPVTARVLLVLAAPFGSKDDFTRVGSSSKYLIDLEQIAMRVKDAR